MTMKYVFDLLVDMRVVRNEDFGAMLVMFLGLHGCAFHGLLCSMHDKLYVIAGITIVEKNLADVLKFILQCKFIKIGEYLTALFIINAKVRSLIMQPLQI